MIRELLDHGYEVLSIDIRPSAASSSLDSPAPFLAADVTDYGQALEAMSGSDAVVHLAAIPSPVHATPDLVFRTNITSTHAVFAAAVRLELQRVVWASSETTLGLPFDEPPDYAPIDEAHVLRPESSYALSKVLGEEAARQFNRWSGIPFVGLRFSNIMERADYGRVSRPSLGRSAAPTLGHLQGLRGLKAASARAFDPRSKQSSTAQKPSSSPPPTPSCAGRAEN